MKQITKWLAAAALLTFGTGAAQAVPLSFDWTRVDDTDNVGEVQSQGTFGAVDYTYRISTTEVTNAQYAEFLNNVADSDANSLWNDGMDITRTGSDPNYVYTANATYEQKPVNNVSYFNAMRFVNWLENGQPTGVQDATTTEDGTYLISDGISETRAEGAFYFLPSEDEWYKAAYYDPGLGGSGGYWDYPTQSDTAPTAEVPAGGANSANFSGAVVGMGMETTEVGAYTGTSSYYGGFDFGGNVWEWTEGVNGSDRVIRGGTWDGFASFLAASSRSSLLPGGESSIQGVGFRIASLPEPGTALLAMIGGLLLTLFSGRRCRKRTLARI